MSARRSPVLVAGLAVLAAAGLALAVPTSGAAASTALPATTSTTHPYSDPVWYPLRAKMWMNCAGGGGYAVNPGCSNTGKDFYSIDEVVPDNKKAGVYAMGAGIVHIETAHGASCPASPSSFGTALWIDHGGGTVSRYGHFSSLSVKSGQYVAAGQLLGMTGTTGKAGSCTNTYVDYEVLKHGVHGQSVPVKTLKACRTSTTTTASTWPSALNSNWTSWNKVPMGGSPPRSIPAAGSKCLPTGAPKTPTEPTGITFSHSGSGAITVHWTKAVNASSVAIQWAALVSGNLPAVQNLHYMYLPRTATSHKFSGLHNGTTYGFRFQFHNAVGSSRGTSTRTFKATA